MKTRRIKLVAQRGNQGLADGGFKSVHAIDEARLGGEIQAGPAAA